MDYETRPLPFDAGRLDGLSQRLVESHHRNNYGGAVRRLNAIRARLRALDPGQSPGFELNGLKREQLLASNSLLLHEVHFDSLGGAGEIEPGPLRTALAAAFGSYERWRAEFVALGRALAGGSGWVLLSWLPRGATLANQWAADHAHALAEATPIVALDMYEHAYHLDYGAAAGDYVQAFMRNLHWARIAERFERAVAASVAGIEVAPESVAPHLAGWQVIDVRRRPVFDVAGHTIARAGWRDPERVDEWARELDRARPVAVYCVHGHAISRTTALRWRGAASTRVAWQAASRHGRRAGCRCRKRGMDDEVGHTRTAEDRSHRLSVADCALHRSRRRIPVRAGGAGAGSRAHGGRNSIRRAGR